MNIHVLPGRSWSPSLVRFDGVCSESAKEMVSLLCPLRAFLSRFPRGALVKTKGPEEVQNSKFLFMRFCIRERSNAFATVHEQDQV